MGKNNPYSITTQEISTIFWLVGFMIIMIAWIDPGMPIVYKLLIFIGLIFTLISFFTPCYQISKYNLNMFIDKITNPDFENWLRVTKTRVFAPQTVKKGVLGQSKGIVHGAKADIINKGDFTITLQNGNHGLIKYDTLSHNINLNETLGWKLIRRKFGFIGSKAFQKCYSDGKSMRILKKRENKKTEKEDSQDGKKQ